MFGAEARSNSVVSVRAVLLQSAKYWSQSAGRAVTSADVAMWWRQADHVHQRRWH